MKMRILGYSERGIVSSVLHEIAYSDHSYELLSAFLSLITYPFTKFPAMNIEEAKIFIEQSFSDFGDLDALILLTVDGMRISIFFEAKVKPIQASEWRIHDEWDKFRTGISNQVSSSNLFTQLYHKVRLVQGLKKSGVPGLQSGLTFPPCSTKTSRKIGSNNVVLRAIGLLQEHLDNPFFVALVPGDSYQVGSFFETSLRESQPDGFIGWDVEHYGFLTWEVVERFCEEYDLSNTLEVFRHNRGQIY